MLPTAANAAVQVAIPKPATPQANMQYNKTIPIYYPRNKTENMEQDKEIFEIIAAEDRRQRKGIELIASENFVSEQVLRAMGSCLTNKYAEGYPGHRYYGGCQEVDRSETLAIERVKRLSAPNTPTCSRTAVHRPIWPYSWPFSIPATNSWDSICHTAATCRTAAPSISPV